MLWLFLSTILALSDRAGVGYERLLKLGDAELAHTVDKLYKRMNEASVAKLESPVGDDDEGTVGSKKTSNKNVQKSREDKFFAWLASKAKEEHEKTGKKARSPGPRGIPGASLPLSRSAEARKKALTSKKTMKKKIKKLQKNLKKQKKAQKTKIKKEAKKLKKRAKKYKQKAKEAKKEAKRNKKKMKKMKKEAAKANKKLDKKAAKLQGKKIQVKLQKLAMKAKDKLIRKKERTAKNAEKMAMVAAAKSLKLTEHKKSTAAAAGGNPCANCPNAQSSGADYLEYMGDDPYKYFERPGRIKRGEDAEFLEKL